MMIWRLLGSVLHNRRQPQTMKHEQAMNDAKNKTGRLTIRRGLFAAIRHYPQLIVPVHRGD
jgi:hypothetical protein